jgi:enoyl-CoA hydratase/carnithine racemase
VSDYEHIQLEVQDPVALIRLNRPDKLNAFTYRTLHEIRSAVDAATADPRVVGIVITGNGRGFCAGLDAQVLAEVTGSGEPIENTPADSDELPGLFSYLLQVPKPVIAAVNGVTAGGGLVLALMCDLRIASSEARFTTVFLKRGLIAEHGTSWILPRLLGTGRALDLLWTSDKVDAEEALSLGLVDKLVPHDELLTAARAYVERLAANASPAAIAETKRLVHRHVGMDYESALREAEASQNRFVAMPDAKEGGRALLEKRAPRFARLGEP